MSVATTKCPMCGKNHVKYPDRCIRRATEHCNLTGCATNYQDPKPGIAHKDNCPYPDMLEYLAKWAPF